MDAYSFRPNRPAAPVQNPVFSGVVTAPPGTVAQPSLRFSSTDPGTGIYSPGDGALAFTVAGTAKLRLDSHMRSYANLYLTPPTGNPAAYLWSVAGNGWAFYSNAQGDNALSLAEYSGANFVANRLAVQKGGTITVGGAVGAEAVRVIPANPAGNRIDLEGAGPGVGPRIAAAGADGAVNLRLAAKGQGCIVLENLPTSSTGLPPGGLWNSAGTLRVA